MVKDLQMFNFFFFLQSAQNAESEEQILGDEGNNEMCICLS